MLYDISSDGTYAEVIGYEGTANKVKIAEEYNGLPVKNICQRAFDDKDTITDVIIPNSVTSIGNDAFSNCSSLVSVLIGDSVTTIGEYAFFNCSSLVSVLIGDSVNSIGGCSLFSVLWLRTRRWGSVRFCIWGVCHSTVSRRLWGCRRTRCVSRGCRR